MGQDISSQSNKILNSYLLMGLLEILSEEDGDQPISQDKVVKELRDSRLSNKEYVLRHLVPNIQKWLRDVGVSISQLKSYIDVGPRGIKHKKFHSDVYKDCLAGLLFLNMLEDGMHMATLNRLADKMGEKALSIVTKLTIAKRTRSYLKVYPESNDNRIADIKFLPKKFILIQGKWIIQGINSDNDEIEFEISRISKIEV